MDCLNLISITAGIVLVILFIPHFSIWYLELELKFKLWRRRLDYVPDYSQTKAEQEIYFYKMSALYDMRKSLYKINLSWKDFLKHEKAREKMAKSLSAIGGKNGLLSDL